LTNCTRKVISKIIIEGFKVELALLRFTFAFSIVVVFRPKNHNFCVTVLNLDLN